MPLAVGKLKMLHLGKWALFQHLPRASGFSPIKDRGFPGGSVVKNLPASAGDTGSIPGWEDLLEEKAATLSCILARRIPWTEEPDRVTDLVAP